MKLTDWILVVVSVIVLAISIPVAIDTQRRLNRIKNKSRVKPKNKK